MEVKDVKLVKVVRRDTGKFVEAAKGPYSNKVDIDIECIAGLPFEIPEDIATARIKASPAMYRLATDEDDVYAKKLIADQKALLDAKLVPAGKPEVFDAVEFLKNVKPTEESLSELEQDQLFEIAVALEIKTPKNTGKEKLIEKILEATEE